MSASPAPTVAPVSELSREYRFWRWNILLSTYFGYAGFYLCRKVYSIAKPLIKDSLQLDWTQIADIWSGFLLAYMLGQFLTGVLGRKCASKTLLLGGLGLSMIVNLLMGFSNNYWTFLAMMVFNGFFQSTGWPSSVGAIAHWIRPQERGFLMGLWSTSYMLGTLVVKLAGGFLLTYAGWRWSFAAATLVTSFCWLLLLWRHHDKPEDVGLAPLVVPSQKNDADIQGVSDKPLTLLGYFQLALHPVVLTMGLGYLCVKFLRYALDSWIPTFLAVEMHLSVDQASYYSILFDLCGILPTVLAGWALDRLFKGNWAMLMLLAAMGMILAFLIAIQFDTSALAVAVCFGLVGFMIFGPDSILTGAASVQVAGEKNSLAVAGLVNGIGSIGPIIQESVIGRLMKSDETRGMHNANLLCLALCIVFFVLMAVATVRRHQALKRRTESGET